MMDSSTRAENGAERTILTTDVVGSTALLHRFPRDLIGAMDQHDQILQAAILRHRGTPFKNTGDGIFAIFDRPMDAIAAAIDIQRDMRAALWGPTGRLLIRCGIHTGVVRARGSDFFGPALPTAARLQSAANADQTLVSSATITAIASDPARSNFMLTDLGEHHFKGIEPVRVFQVGAADLPHVFPPIGGKRETASGNLPANLTSFLGRARELRSLLELTADARIITLVGPGGIGKTRLAIEFARSLEASFQDGAWMVDLAALERGSEV
ncbi:MAG TPA: adenylate/guanylate cyclase domain-containing protein, partial [Acetobacteraceae bacterium]|nr:adenylate/guanylate cyclase domain-containing protein [Acetobacteraceae bacterium]